MEIIHAAAHFEEVERVVRKLFCGRAGGKRSVVEIAAVQAAQAGRDRGAGIFVRQVQFDQGRKTKSKPSGIGFWEMTTEEFVEQEYGFKIRGSRRVFNPADQFAQIQPLAGFGGSTEQALQSAAKISSLADVWL